MRLAAWLVAAAWVPGALAFLDNSLPRETFHHRGIDWDVPRQTRTPGGFDWDLVAGCVDHDSYHYFCRTSRKLAITLDDGPAEFTNEALDILARMGATATFCAMGQMMSTPEAARTIKRIADEGHALCIHTTNHLHLTELSSREIIDEIMGTMDRFKQILGYTPRYFRAPFGEYDMRVRAIVQQLGLTVLNWNLDLWDWRMDASASLERMRGALRTVGTWDGLNPAGPSIIVLAHDIYGTTVRETLGRSIELARDAGWQVVSVTDDSCIGQSRWLEDDWAPPPSPPPPPPPPPPAPATTATTTTAATSSSRTKTQSWFTNTTAAAATRTQLASSSVLVLTVPTGAARDDVRNATASGRPVTITSPENGSASQVAPVSWLLVLVVVWEAMRTWEYSTRH
ncbi:hypothetical protein DFJ74DRAFT_696287 [Hyaloraphidium curvatum]|nr:hypothetical protein DFJ74DRAFT_696287 [Hyaloraphidium curvatum]